jgi:hypothetical protein
MEGAGPRGNGMHSDVKAATTRFLCRGRFPVVECGRVAGATVAVAAPGLIMTTDKSHDTKEVSWLPAATCSSLVMAEYRVCTPILILTIQARMRHGFDGLRTVSGEVDNHP